MTQRRWFRNPIVGALAFAAVLLALALAEANELISGVARERGVGILFGLYFIVIGNSMPKTLDRVVGGRCSLARLQALQRFSGWVFVLMGLVYTLSWIVLPPETAGAIDVFIILPAVLLVLGRLAWVCLTSRQTRPEAAEGRLLPED